jgi:hypothetical protein
MGVPVRAVSFSGPAPGVANVDTLSGMALSGSTGLRAQAREITDTYLYDPCI